MRTRISTIMLAAMTVVAAGCGEDNVPDMDGHPQAGVPTTGAGTAVSVRVGVGEMEKRAGHGSDNLPKAFILNFAAEGGNEYKDVMMTRDASTGQYQPSETMTWGTESREAFVTAWMEPVAILHDSTTLPIVRVAYDQTSADSISRSDFLCATTELRNGSVTIKGDVIDIAFLHVFSKIDIRCHLGNELTSRYPDAKVSKVEISGVYRGAPFNFDYGTPTLAGNEHLRDQGTMTAYLDEPDAGTGDVTAEAVIVPQYFIYDLSRPDLPDTRPRLTITLTNEGVEKVMPAVPVTTGSILSGKRYTMTVNISNDVVVPGELTALPWTEGDTWTMETE